MNNPAFEYLRQFKKVSDETEELVIKFVKKKYPEISVNELVTIFENGIAGEFGKIYSADPETLLDWIRKHTIKKGSERSYYETPLLTKDITIYHHLYPTRADDWLKEVNKAFTAYLNGVSVYEMHEHIYDRLMVDGKIEMNSYIKYLVDSVEQAKQKYLKDYFEYCKRQGLNQIYFIKKTNE